MELVTFGDAIAALVQGKRATRLGWNGKDLFVAMQVPSEIGMNIVPKMQSLPQSVKDEFIRRESTALERKTTAHLSIRYYNQLILIDPDNNIYGWAPSPSDSLATDWQILD